MKRRMALAVDYYGIEEELTEDERLVQTNVRRFVEEKIIPVVPKHYQEGTFPLSLIPQFAELGLLGANLTGYGCAGMGEVAGPMGQLTDKVGSGYGFAAIIVAFVGRLNAFGILLASLLMALLYIGGEQAQQYLNLPNSISMVFQGMLLFFLLGADVFIHYRLRLRRRGA